MSLANVNNTLYVKNETLKNLTAARDYSWLVDSVAIPTITTAASVCPQLPFFGSMYFGYKALYSALDLKSDLQATQISYSDVAVDALKTLAWSGAALLSIPNASIKGKFLDLPVVGQGLKSVDNKLNANFSPDTVVKLEEGAEAARKAFVYDKWVPAVIATNTIYNGATELHAFNDAIEHIATIGEHQSFAIDY